MRTLFMEKKVEHHFYEKNDETVLLGYLFRCSHMLPRMVEENSSQRRALSMIDHGEGFNQKRLAELMGIRQPSMSELLAKLESKGYIRREKAAGKRMVNIHITEEGKAALDDLETAHEKVVQNIFSGLDKGEIEKLLTLMDKLLKSWE